MQNQSFPSPVTLFQPDARGPYLLTCEHASFAIPAAYKHLGLAPEDRTRHIAWDIGANEMARLLAEQLQAPLISANYSRLLIDLNREPGAPDRFPSRSEDTPIPGNFNLSPDECQRRHEQLYEPFHQAIAQIIDSRLGLNLPTIPLAIHSFTPHYFQQQRPWQVGILSHLDRRLANPLLAALRAEPELCVGDNKPYDPNEGVYHTMERHADRRNLPSVMIEVRQDLISSAQGQAEWAQRFARILRTIQL